VRYGADRVISAKSHPASDAVVLRPESSSVDCGSYRSCGSCGSCSHAPHLVASGVSGDLSQYWVPS